MAACRGRGLRVDRPRWTRGRRPRPGKRIFAVFGLVRQWVASAIWSLPGQGGVAGLHPRPRQAATPPASTSSSTACRWRRFALSFRRGLALGFRRTAVPRSVDDGLAVVVLRDTPKSLRRRTSWAPIRHPSPYLRRCPERRALCRRPANGLCRAASMCCAASASAERIGHTRTPMPLDPQ